MAKSNWFFCILFVICIIFFIGCDAIGEENSLVIKGSAKVGETIRISSDYTWWYVCTDINRNGALGVTAGTSFTIPNKEYYTSWNGWIFYVGKYIYGGQQIGGKKIYSNVIEPIQTAD
jgi:hypothetical protein